MRASGVVACQIDYAKAFVIAGGQFSHTPDPHRTALPWRDIQLSTESRRSGPKEARYLGS